MYPITILERTPVADHMITLKTSKPSDFDFTAGQFVQFMIPIEDGTVKPRSYSIASVPEDDHLLFLIKLLPEGLASDYLRTDSCIGTTLTMSEARGRFVVADDAPSHLFVATGSGMAPILAMLRSELEIKQSTKEMILYFGVRHTTGVFWQKELAMLTIDHPNFTYHITLSKPEKEWDGLRGRVTDHIEAHHSIHHTYLCGSAPMVMEVRKLLMSHSAESKQIHFEIF